ncbi:hypothetical protein DOTSEDRAFT_72335 [Dothistroma septosporum NZE10]|uniref:Methyltransferase type 11 domain-containing protein n=1 Tax=Dothistroma septosporum (strain NZE10 / CBS 128990) TaxID=675120 RepID=M2YLS8_DOTSN|nr:hypothetical protein DOTSEDRAFT_72335 [Dothistroma septosporum NZE10]
MAHNHDASAWDTHSDRWASSVQAVTRAPCKEMLAMTTSLSPITKTSIVFDNGAGSGMQTSLVLEEYPGTQITATDVSSGMIDNLKKNQWPTVTAHVADATDLESAGLKDKSFTHSMGTFFIPFVSDPDKVVREMARVTKPGGVVGLATWHKDTPSWSSPLQIAVRQVMDPKWTAPEVFHPATTDPDDVRKMFEKAGLEKIQVKVFDCPHPQKESVDVAVEEFFNMGNPSVKILLQDFNKEQITKLKPAFAKAYAEVYDGVKKPQKERAVLIVGRVAS